MCLTDLCHERFLMTAVTGAGTAQFWDKAAYLERVAGRDPFPGEPSYEILSVDSAGDETARDASVGGCAARAGLRTILGCHQGGRQLETDHQSIPDHGWSGAWKWMRISA